MIMVYLLWGFIGGIYVACIGLSLAYVSTISSDKVERTSLIANVRAVTILAAIPSSCMY